VYPVAKVLERVTGSFPQTRSSLIADVRSPDRERRQRALEAVVAAYWKPVYKYVRIRWRSSPEDAQDLTQGFFTVALEKEFLAAYDASRARFRTYLRTCVDGFVANERRATRRLKRGGGAELLPLDFPDAEGELRHHEVPADADMDEYFRREWVRHVFGLAVTALERECAAAGRAVHFALFKRYDIEEHGAHEPLSYAALAAEAGLPLTQVTNHLAWARRAFRRVVLATLREATCSEEEFRAEARDVLGVDAR
jgi:DNA-directed RNA polymerase specialized sigma24 family protein